MPIELTEAGRGAPFTGDYQAELTALQERLARLQIAQKVHKRRAIVLFEGWEGSGLKAALKRLVASWDPCHVRTLCVSHDESFDEDRHWLAPFWANLPSGGDTSLYFHSWYRKLADNRVAGRIDEARLARYCDEINEFEAQQGDHDTIVVKLFFHVSSAVQRERIEERQRDPWLKHLVTTHDLLSSQKRTDYRAAWNELFAQTDSRWAPWHLVNGDDKRGARIAALSLIADEFEKRLPGAPPGQVDNVVKLVADA
ncbi:polyphosphate kinase 2 family protein [Sphingomicrobium nitratireducens]|uniref:polyphosphate kinase 2 family protein n=1 Tax=Sphingomicrobium nitratireducens TaxID=2964666 RepID=UPI00223FA9FC